MGYQFIHLENFSRKADDSGRTTDFVFAEASRKPEASVHVTNPSAPIVVFGLDADTVRQRHDAAVASAVVSIKGGKTRRIRQDQKTLHTVVASHPATMLEVNADPAIRREAEEWERRTIEWLQSRYHDDLVCVLRHEDEAHFHLHAYVVPLSDPEMRAQKYHPGVSAKRAVLDAGPRDGEDQKALGKRADAAYKSAMRAWQDSYHDAVAIPCGLTRLGPQRRRLSRDEWQKEQAQAKSLKKTLERASRAKSDGDAFILRTKERAAAVIEAAKKEKQAAAEAVEHAEHAQASAGQVLAKIEKYAGWIGFLRAIWDHIRRSSISQKIKLEAAEEIQRWRSIARAAEERRRDEEQRRREMEKQAHRAQERATHAELAVARLSASRRTAKPEIIVGPRR